MQRRNCLMCDHLRERNSLFCKECKVYEPYKNEGWYKELMRMEHVQSRINRRERFPLLVEHPANLDGSPIKESIGLSKPAGRPRKYTPAMIEQIRQLYIEHGGKMPVRTFTRLINEAGIPMSRETVRKVMAELCKDAEQE